MRWSALLPVLVCLGVLAGKGADLHAQLPADTEWRTIESARFRVTWGPGLEPLARHAIARAERAHSALSELVADAPAGTIDIVLADNVDFSNGYATPFPSNRIVIYARPPVDVLGLQYAQDWIDLVVTHELAHIFHLDVSGPVGSVVRRLFGRTPFGWPVFPAVGSPLWSVEGLAVLMESVPGFGRVHGSYHEMVVRTAAIEDEIDDIYRLSSTSPVWPGAARIYIYGSLFYDFLQRRYGADATARIVRRTATSALPAPVWFDRIGQSAIGISFDAAYDVWRAELDAEYTGLRQQLEAEGLTESTSLTRHGGYAVYPRFSPDGRRIAYAADDGRDAPETRVIDVASREVVRSERRNDQGVAAWLPDGRLLTSWIDHVDAFRIYGDLHLVGPDESRRITRSSRLQNVDVSRSGRGVAVENGGGTNRIVMVDPTSGEQRAITPFDRDVHWSLPRFDPSGARIAVTRWREGARHDIVVMDTTGAITDAVGSATGSAISAAPAWSPDGEWLLFWSDRTGIPNIHASRPDGSDVRQVTNVLTGAFYPDVSPDGRTIAYSAYHHDGFHIEVMPFDTADWRASAAERATPRPNQSGHANGPHAIIDSALVAAARADTTAGPARGYSPFTHLRPWFWLPEMRAGGAGDDLLGVRTRGQDLVQRHIWNAALAISPWTGRLEGDFDYTYRGLSTISGIGIHPSVRAFALRDWESLLPPAVDGGRYIDEREDVAGLTLDLTRTRWRSVAGASITGEAVRRSRSLHNVDSLRLRDPTDDMIGLNGRAYFANAVLPRFGVSRQNGVSLQVSARRRFDLSPLTTPGETGDVTSDASYSELTSWNAAYLALPLPGFARHVLAARVSGVLRSGPGSGLTRLGGVTGSSLTSSSVLGAPPTTALLPLRGFERGVRLGNRGWAASAEYRAPVALVSRSLPLLPVFIDRIALTGFVDAGHAWCSPDIADRFGETVCTSTSASHSPLAGAGAEAIIFISLFDTSFPVRLTGAVPVNGIAPSRQALFYLSLGPSF